jgi:dTDP-4-dehydrorhamnose 3,5-epimerase
MPLLFSETNISGLMVITSHQFKDERGAINKYFEKDAFWENGLSTNFSEFNLIKSHKGVLRGLHYQSSPSQSRLLYAIAGSVFYVVLDLRSDSCTFGNYETFYLSDDQNKAIFIPENFAVGSLSLVENTLVSYLCAGPYIPDNGGGIIWCDKDLNIPWPENILNTPLIISEKDKNLQTFQQYNELLS